MKLIRILRSKQRQIQASLTALAALLVLASGCGTGIIGPCNPPQLACATPTAGSTENKTQAPASDAAPVTFGGTVVVDSSGSFLSPAPAAGQASASPTPPVAPTATPQPGPPPAALLFARQGETTFKRVELDASGTFSASLAPGTYSVAAVLRTAEGGERVVTGVSATLVFAAGESFTLQATVTGPPGEEQLVVEKKPVPSPSPSASPAT